MSAPLTCGLITASASGSSVSVLWWSVMIVSTLKLFKRLISEIFEIPQSTVMTSFTFSFATSVINSFELSPCPWSNLSGINVMTFAFSSFNVLYKIVLEVTPSQSKSPQINIFSFF